MSWTAYFVSLEGLLGVPDGMLGVLEGALSALAGVVEHPEPIAGAPVIRRTASTARGVPAEALRITVWRFVEARAGDAAIVPLDGLVLSRELLGPADTSISRRPDCSALGTARRAFLRSRD